MTGPAAAPRDGSRLPAVEVRSIEGELLRKIPPPDAEVLYRSGRAEWIGRGRGAYLRLTVEAPWRGGSHTTRRDRADQTCRTYAAGQAFGGPRTVEHR